MNNKVKHFDANTIGKDYIVGDLHGCIDTFEQALNAIGFDKTTDRMFSVGDLVDRGPDSYHTACLIYQPWFHSVRGNHDQMFISCFIGTDDQLNAHYVLRYGGWMYDGQRTMQQLAALAADMESMMPYIISVGEGNTRFNVVHAELIKDNVAVSDDDIDAFNFTPSEVESMLWGRELAAGIAAPRTLNSAKVYDQTNLSLTYCGHTPVAKVYKQLNQVFIDRGCVFAAVRPQSPQCSLAIACHTDQVVHSWNPISKTLDTSPIPHEQQ